jgi:ankyrin repeat protein
MSNKKSPGKKSPGKNETIIHPEQPKSLLKYAQDFVRLKNSNNIQKYKELAETILKVIHDKNFNKNELNSLNQTPLMIFIKNTEEDKPPGEDTTSEEYKKIEEDIIINLINSDESNPGQVDLHKNTALIIACSHNLEKIAFLLVKTEKSNPGIMDNNNETALMHACRKNLSKVAYSIVRTGQSNIEAKNNDNETALMIACMNNFTRLALGLIQTGKSSPEVVDHLNNTALIYACQNKMEDVALYLIDTGDSNPGVINSNNETAIIIACQNSLSYVVLELINNTEIDLNYLNYAGETLLIIACNNTMEEVALKLIETEKIDLNKKDSEGNTAFDIAKNNNLQDVVDELKEQLKMNIDKIHILDVNAKGYNMITSSNDVIVKDYLSESYNNICILVNDNYYFTSKKIIKKQLIDTTNIKYACYVAGDNVYNTSGEVKGKDYTSEDNIDYSAQYFSMSSIIPLQILVNLDDITNIVNNKFSSNMYALVSSNKILPGIIAPDFDGEIGSDHCQTGKSREVYNILTANSDCLSEFKKEIYEKKEIEHIIKIMYNSVTYTFPITLTTKLGEIKQQLLDRLFEKELITTKNQNARFIFSGKVFKEDNIELKKISNPPYEITMNVSLTSNEKKKEESPKKDESPKKGGRKTKKRKSIRKKKTMKRL